MTGTGALTISIISSLQRRKMVWWNSRPSADVISFRLWPDEKAGPSLRMAMQRTCRHYIASSLIAISSRIFEHFATLPDAVTEFIKLRSALYRQGTILVPKQADLLSLLKKQIHLFHLDRVVSQSQIQQPDGSKQYLYYINMLVGLK
jgi:hypothetical protein